MTQTERLILENQIVLLTEIAEQTQLQRMRNMALTAIKQTESHLNESEQDGGH